MQVMWKGKEGRKVVLHMCRSINHRYSNALLQAEAVHKTTRYIE